MGIAANSPQPWELRWLFQGGAVPSTPAAPEWRRGSRMVIRAMAISLGLVALLQLLPPGWAAARDEPALLLPLLGLGAACALAVASVWTGREGPVVRAVVLVLALASLVALSQLSSSAHPGVLWWPMQSLVALGPYLAVTATSAGEVLVVAAGTWILPWLLTPQPNGHSPGQLDRYELAGGATVAAATVAAALVLRGVGLVLAATAAATQEAVDDETRSEDDRARSRQVQAAARYVHDRVLHTLQAAAMDRRDLSSTAVRTEMQRLSQDLDAGEEQLPPGATLDLLDALRAQPHGRLRVRCSGRAVAVPRAVGNAMVKAVGECLRNVERHAGVGVADVVVTGDATQVEVRVEDAGRGFDPQPGAAGRRGLADSVVGRMAAVGGQAQIDSNPRSGTRVTLSWRLPTSSLGRQTWYWHERTLRLLALTFLWTIVPFALALVVQACLVLPYFRVPWLGLVVVLAGVLVVGVGLVRVDRGMSGLGSALLGLTCVAMAAASAHAADISVGATLTNVVSAATFGASVQLVYRPLWEAVATCLVITGVTIAHTFHGPTDVPFVVFIPLLLVTVVPVIIGVGLRAVVRIIGRDALLADECRAQARASAQVEQAIRVRVAQRLSEVSDLVRPFVDGIAAGRLDPACPEVRTGAAELERAIRDDLSLGDAPAVRSALRSLRQAGAVVTVRCAEPLPATVHPAAAEILTDLGDRMATEGVSRASVDLVFDRDVLGQTSEVELSLLVRPSVRLDLTRWAHLQASAVEDDGACHLTVALDPAGAATAAATPT